MPAAIVDPIDLLLRNLRDLTSRELLSEPHELTREINRIWNEEGPPHLRSVLVRLPENIDDALRRGTRAAFLIAAKTLYKFVQLYHLRTHGLKRTHYRLIYLGMLHVLRPFSNPSCFAMFVSGSPKFSRIATN